MAQARLIDSEGDVRASYAVMKQLRPHLSEDEYVERVKLMREKHGYHLAALYDGETIRCVAGFRLDVCLHWGAFVYVDDLVSDDSQRSRGHGKALLDWVADYGKQRGHDVVRLDSGVQRADAHRFYFREGFHAACFHFLRS